MEIKNACVATVGYLLKNEQGEVVDSSDDGGPMVVLVGNEEILPGIENALIGHSVGDQFEVNIPQEEAYGERNDALIDKVPRENFPGIEDIQPGMMFQTQMEDGEVLMITVVDADDDTVTVDGNHPMAGQPLNFTLEILEVRGATEEELSHGHVHGEGSHCES